LCDSGHLGRVADGVQEHGGDRLANHANRRDHEANQAGLQF